MLRLLLVSSYEAIYNYTDSADERPPLLLKHANLLHLGFK
jgi:hypothetical protein